MVLYRSTIQELSPGNGGLEQKKSVAFLLRFFNVNFYLGSINEQLITIPKATHDRTYKKIAVVFAEFSSVVVYTAISISIMKTIISILAIVFMCFFMFLTFRLCTACLEGFFLILFVIFMIQFLLVQYITIFRTRT